MQNENYHEDEINLLECWNVLWRRKYMLIALFVVSVAATMAISLNLPKFYTSETVIITMSSESGGLGAALSALPFAGSLGGVAGIQTPADRIMVVLKSRTIAEAVIKKFDLVRVLYQEQWVPEKAAWKDPDKHPLLEDAVKRLTKQIVRFNKSKEGAITVSAEWTDPRLAAEIANYYVSALTAFLNEKSVNVTIQVVDRAIPAERKSRPRVALNMMLAGALSGFIGIFISFLLEYIQKQKRSSAATADGNSKPVIADKPSLAGQ